MHKLNCFYTSQILFSYFDIRLRVFHIFPLFPALWLRHSDSGTPTPALRPSRHSDFRHSYPGTLTPALWLRHSDSGTPTPALWLRHSDSDTLTPALQLRHSDSALWSGTPTPALRLPCIPCNPLARKNLVTSGKLHNNSQNDHEEEVFSDKNIKFRLKMYWFHRYVKLLMVVYALIACIVGPFGEHRRAVSNDANQPVADISILVVIAFQTWKFEPSVPFLVATIAAKDRKCVSFPNLEPYTPWY